jgi:hypothetical protein
MLRQGTSVTRSALDSGFENLSHFSRTFRRRFRVSPSSYRDVRPLQHEPALRAGKDLNTKTEESEGSASLARASVQPRSQDANFRGRILQAANPPREVDDHIIRFVPGTGCREQRRSFRRRRMARIACRVRSYRRATAYRELSTAFPRDYNGARRWP